MKRARETDHSPRTRHTPRFVDSHATCQPARKRQRLTPRSTLPAPSNTMKRKRSSNGKPDLKRRYSSGQDTVREIKRCRPDPHSRVQTRQRTACEDYCSCKPHHEDRHGLEAPTPLVQSPASVETEPDLIEELDISETPGMNGEAGKGPSTEESAPLRAELLGDGRCMVRIVRSDGRVDFYTLLPL